LPYRRELFSDDRPIKLGGRALDVLLVLIETPGAVISKDVLMARVWPDRIVEENNLHAQIRALRKTFGADQELIRTVVGRGYQFTGEVRVLSASPNAAFRPAVAPSAPVLPLTNVPEAVSELIGREEELGEILNLATAHRLVTLTGAGGIGKTTLALALARELRRHSADGVWLVEFSGLADPRLVPAAVAAAVGLELGGGEASAQRVAQVLANRRLLLVVDTCEHVIDAATAFAEAILRASSTLHVIATSREPLRAEGEWVHALRPLAVPADAPLTTNSLCNMAPFGCLSSARGRQKRILHPTESSWRRSRRSVGNSTASHWRLNWPRRASPRWASRNSPPISTIDFVCSPAEGGRPCRGTRRCGRRSTGATNCWPSPSA
jgi:DNA-binding winged helix-turn-helix (wHTH) protein